MAGRRKEENTQEKDARSITTRLDRVRISSWAHRKAKVPEIEGYETVYDHRLQPKGEIATYGRVRKLKSRDSDAAINWQYERRQGFLKQWRIELIGDDQTGIRAKDLARVFKRCRHYRITLVELAVDLGFDVNVDGVFVRRHAHFGKSRRRNDRGGKGQLRYGGRKSGKLVRCYSKPQVNAYRVELELHSRVLRKLRIEEGHDIPRVAFAVIPRHLEFVRVRWGKLSAYLRRRFGRTRAQHIEEAARTKAKISLASVMRYLRRTGVANPHRFRGPMKLNERVEEALAQWALDFRDEFHEEEYAE